MRKGTGPVDPKKLKSYVDRVRALKDEQKARGIDVKAVLDEAKENDGLMPQAVRKIVAEQMRKENPELASALDEYRAALGMAVAAVVSGELSLREAGRAFNVPKSNVHKALSVQRLSHDPETGELPREMTADDLGDFDLIKPKPKKEREPKAADDFGQRVREMIERLGLKIPEHVTPAVIATEMGPLPDFLRRH